jgi:hypothetical protein
MPKDIFFEEDNEVDIVVDNDIDDNQDAEDELLGDDGGEGIADSDAIDIIIAQDGDEEFCYEADYDDEDLCDNSDTEPDGDEDDEDEEPDGDEDDLDEDVDDGNQNEYEDFDDNF